MHRHLGIQLLTLGLLSLAGIQQAAATEAQPVSPRRLISNSCSNPIYPMEAERAGQVGTVTLELRVKQDGTVAETRVAQSSGFPLLDQAASDAMRRCRFQPGGEAAQPKGTWAQLKYSFKINRPDCELDAILMAMFIPRNFESLRGFCSTVMPDRENDLSEVWRQWQLRNRDTQQKMKHFVATHLPRLAQLQRLDPAEFEAALNQKTDMQISKGISELLLAGEEKQSIRCLGYLAGLPAGRLEMRQLLIQRIPQLQADVLSSP